MSHTIMAVDGTTLVVPTPLPEPPTSNAEVATEMIRQNKLRGNPPRADVMHHLTLIDWEFHGASPGGDPGTGTLDDKYSQAHALIGAFTKAVEDTRGAWGDPTAITERVVGLERSTVDGLSALYRSTHVAAQAHVAAARPPRPSPDDAVVMDIAASVIRNFDAAATYEWFFGRHAEGHPSWSMLRQIVDRIARKPPAHLNVPEYQKAFASLAAQPFDDPFTKAREARELAAETIRRVRLIASDFATSAGAAGM